MVRHFEKRKDAKAFLKENTLFNGSIKLFKKVKGQKNRIKKPFIVCTEFEWLNLY